MKTHPTHQVIERDGVEAPRTIYAAGLYAVSERDLGLVGAYLPWGRIEALAAAWHGAGDPDAILARVLSTDNPHGEPPPNPCPTCGRAP